MSAVRAARHSHVNGDGYFCRGYDPKAEWGCNLLRDRMHECFATFEHRLGLEPGEGQYHRTGMPWANSRTS
jgi:hypothetical protein